MATTTCPVFYPTLEEFSQGLEKYIESVESRVKPYGICKVVPPAGWWTPPDYDKVIANSTKVH